MRVRRRPLLALIAAAAVAPLLLSHAPGLAQAPTAGPDLTVTSSADAGDGVCDASCTLRDAINTANAGTTARRIRFAIGSGAATIALAAPLPALETDGTTIDGSTQPGYDGRPLIYLEGGGVVDASGLVSRAAAVEIRAIAVGGFDRFGILVVGEAADNNRLLGNWAGLNAAGTGANPNALSGIAVIAGPSGTLIGDGCARCGNRAAGNSVPERTGQGILVGGAGTVATTIRGNVVGLGPGGVPLPNDDGILIVDGAHATVGGVEPGAGNIVAASRVAGIELRATSTQFPLRVLGNRVGLDEGARPAGNDVGIFVADGAGGIEIGGATPGAGNVVAANRVGIAIEDRAHDVRVLGNRIGMDPLGELRPNRQDGVSVLAGARLVAVGGGRTGEGNWIVGGENGVTIAGEATSSVSLLGNVIGLTPGGLLAGSVVGVRVSGGIGIAVGLRGVGGGNVIVGASEAGVLLEGASQVSVAGNRIGLRDDDTPAGNAVGVLLRDGARDNRLRDNRIGGNVGAGVAVQGDASLRNSLHENTFLANGGLGIDLGLDGVSANDPDDADLGPNRLLNAPVLESLVHDGERAEIVGRAGALQRVALYRVGADDLPALLPHASGHGPGVEPLIIVRANADGVFQTRVRAPAGVVVTALALDGVGNTSEFARNLVSDPPALLRAGFTPVAWLGPATLAAEALGAIGERLEAAFRFEADAQAWSVFRPGLAFLSSLDTLLPGDALWLRLSPGPDLLWTQPAAADPAPTVPLFAGLNFVRWSGDPASLGPALAPIAAQLQSAFRWSPAQGRLQAVFPQIPGRSVAPLRRGDLLWLRLSAGVEWPQPRLIAPPGPSPPPEPEPEPPGDEGPATDPDAETEAALTRPEGRR